VTRREQRVISLVDSCMRLAANGVEVGLGNDGARPNIDCFLALFQPDDCGTRPKVLYYDQPLAVSSPRLEMLPAELVASRASARVP